MNRNRSADIAIGYATDENGRGLAYAAIATGSGRAVVRVPFAARNPALDTAREAGLAAVAAVAGEAARRGFTRVRFRLTDDTVIRDLAAPRLVPPALAMTYVKARCVLNGFASARVERAEPREIADFEGRARAELQLRAAA